MLNKPQLYETLARGSSLLAGGAVFILYAAFVLTNPYRGSDLAQDSVFLMTVVAALAGMQIWAVWNRLPVVVIIAFIFSFLPTGMFMLGRQDVFRFIGVAHLAYLLVALFSWLDRREYRANRKAAAEAAALNSD
jgi:hypothetical protein